MLIDINHNPTTRQLRQFAAATLIMLPLVTWLSTQQPMAAALAIVTALAFVALSLVRPNALKPIFVGVSLITWPVGRIVSEITIFLLFYAVFVPAGLVSQLFRRDPLSLRPKGHSNGTWKTHTGKGDFHSYFRMS